jgi:hypothetical protein
MIAFLSFLVYSAFCWWVVFWDGAEILEGWKAGLLFNWFEATLTAHELRVGTAISWVMALVVLLFTYYPI